MNYKRNKPEPPEITIKVSEFTAIVLRDFLSEYTNPTSDELRVYRQIAELHDTDMEEINGALVIVEELLEKALEE